MLSLVTACNSSRKTIFRQFLFLLICTFMMIALLIRWITTDHSGLLKLYFPRNSAPEQSLTELERQSLKTTQHCEVIDIGCFNKKTTIALPAIFADSNVTTRSWCLLHCSRRKLNYAGLTNETKCICGNMFDQLALPEYSNCRKPCFRARSESCGDKNTVEIFRIASRCQRGSLVTKAFGDTRLVGCFQSPSKEVLKANIPKYIINLTCSECVLFCGMEDFPLAMRDNENRCFCWEMNDLLNLTHKLKQCSSNSLDVYRTLAADKRCEAKKLLPKMKNRSTCGLISFPGSGNTWTRHLLEEATRVYTGSVYRNPFLYKNGFIGEKPAVRQGRTIVIKDHFSKKSNMKNYNCAILIIRNPFDALIAEFHRSNTGNQTGFVDDKAFLNPEFKRYFYLHSPWWYNIVEWVVASGKPFHIVFYEDLRKNPIEEIKMMVKFLHEFTHLPINYEKENLLCMSQQMEGLVKRKAPKLKIDPFTKEMKQSLNNIIKRAKTLLKNHNVKKILPNYER